MAPIRDPIHSLSQLKATQLHNLAIALGSACSGNKRNVVGGIFETLTSAAVDGFETSDKVPAETLEDGQPTSIVSIDMGIRNLAYAHLLAPQPGAKRLGDVQIPSIGKLPVLRTWERLNAFPVELQDSSVGDSATASLYTPSRYAGAAYHFIRDMLNKYDPTHILIEQQRFRSGGSSAVAEWTIRVGVFEGMLHAVLRTLQAENKDKMRMRTVTSISPARTTRFWLEVSSRSDPPIRRKKVTGRESKQARIDIVAKSFLNSRDRLAEPATATAKATVMAFMDRWQATSKVAKALTTKQKKKTMTSNGVDTECNGSKEVKLDDLADCLLQGIAWIEWQRMRQLVLQDLNSHEPMGAIQHRLESLARVKVAST